MMTIGRAYADDLGDVLAILNDAAARLHERGIDQWRTGFDADRIAPYIACAEMWLVRDDDGQALATIRATGTADPDFWTPSESSELAMYVSKLARAPHAPAATGTMLLRWVTDHAASLGYASVRLDAWRTNQGLHRYYLDRGWTYVRTVDLPHRRSGALFQRPAAADAEARAAFAPRPAVPGPWFDLGTRVDVASGPHRGVTGTITAIDSPAGSNEGETMLFDPAGSVPPWSYLVQIDGQAGLVQCMPEDVVRMS